MELKKELIQLAKNAQCASRALANISSSKKNKALKAMAAALLKNKELIIKANNIDVREAKKNKLSPALIDRLVLNESRIQLMADSLLEIAKLTDPVGEVIKAWRRPNGLWIHKVRCAIGVIAIIYESRPNVTSDCIALCLKSGNSVILRGGSEAINSNLAIFKVLDKAALDCGIPAGAINLVATKDRKAVDQLLGLNQYIDLVMPRGGEGLINHVASKSKIPVIKHYKGICHVYVDEWADMNMATHICFNAKVQRPGVCNAMESMLVHRDVAWRFLPVMAKKFKDAKVELRGCATTCNIVKGIKKATEEDYKTEYLGLKLSVKVVNNVGEAIEHINNYGSHHSDSIVTENYDNAMLFLRCVDSACVYINASTRFTDGNNRSD